MARFLNKVPDDGLGGLPLCSALAHGLRQFKHRNANHVALQAVVDKKNHGPLGQPVRERRPQSRTARKGAVVVVDKDHRLPDGHLHRAQFGAALHAAGYLERLGATIFVVHNLVHVEGVDGDDLVQNELAVSSHGQHQLSGGHAVNICVLVDGEQSSKWVLANAGVVQAQLVVNKGGNLDVFRVAAGRLHVPLGGAHAAKDVVQGVLHRAVRQHLVVDEQGVLALQHLLKLSVYDLQEGGLHERYVLAHQLVGLVGVYGPRSRNRGGFVASFGHTHTLNTRLASTRSSKEDSVMLRASVPRSCSLEWV
ncbi:hypothetical protein [Thermus phage TSP4]|nr:hypothetical protein [Thermus phage TSP4]